LDPGAVIPAPGEAAPAVGVTGTAAGGGFEGLEHTSLGVSEGDEGTGEALPALDFGDDGTEGVELEPAAAAVDEGEVDTVDLGLSDFDISFGGPEAGEDEGEDEGEGEAEPLPTFGFDDEGEGEGEGEAEPLPTFGFDDDEGEGEGEGEGEPEPLPTFGFDDEGEGEGGGEGEGEPEPLPTFGFGDEGEGEGEPESGEAPAAVEAADTPVDAPETAADEPADAVEAAHEEGAADRAETAAEPAAGAPDEAAPDGASLLDEGRAALERGDVDEGVETLRRAHVALAESGDVNGAIEALSALLEHRPDDREGHQRLVEYAFRSGDNTVLGRAYLGLARCLEAGGDATRARAVYEQVLQVDPENADAQAALGRAAASEEKKVAEVASSEDYVDLGSLILDEPEEKSTRFVVAYEEPTGDEQADFAKMLSQFKEKVAENVDADDVMAHHDLGTAYKEMGLLDEAIAEFQQALRASPDHLPTYELLGQTFLEKGQPEAAIRSLTRALDAPYEVEDELIGIYYHLGRAHEAIEHRDEALDFYERVFSLDINFADVTDRLRTLRGED
ncbi:MAG: tetratricopeptide repeat protein, partial [Gemmatimonadetes bacterium]